MKSKLAGVAVLAVAAVMLTAVAAAGPVAGKQRVAIQINQGGDGFVLTPLTSGALVRDTGKASFCCWRERFVMRDGQSIVLNDPLMTLTGKHGSLVTRNRIEWIDIENGYSVGTLTWKVVRGTGDYARLAGGGRGGIIDLPTGPNKSRFEGVVRLP